MPAQSLLVVACRTGTTMCRALIRAGILTLWLKLRALSKSETSPNDAKDETGDINGAIGAAVSSQSLPVLPGKEAAGHLLFYG